MIGFYDHTEVKRIAGKKSGATIWRWEQQGIFPKRQKTGPNSAGWNMDAVNSWAADPAAWAEHNQHAVAA